ncbi:MAG: MFS transporter [Candidatus Lokiarchaeota archaeon]|nr:MFS transporter [Candidatus Lokiarchaeota archaeon]MBD3200429.1 MFS transporter [Candidatus Lokiarchaeota archaeon]
MEKSEDQISHSKREIASYGFGSFSREFMRIAFSASAFYFFEKEINLNVWLVSLAFVLFAIYNMFNDPLIGYLTNRPFNFTKKLGRRFPWILIGGLPWGLSYMLIFVPPTTNAANDAWLLFFWLLFTTCLFDTFHSIFFVNFIALFPHKFKTMKERRLTSGIQIMIGVVGTALGAIVPPLVFEYGNIPSFFWQGLVSLMIVTIGFILAIPGVKESPELIEEFFEKYDRDAEKPSFFQSMKIAINQRSFIVFMAIYTLYQSLVETMQSSIPYIIRYSLGMPSNAQTLVFAGFLIGVLISTPLWTKLSHRLNDNRKVMTIAAIMLGLFTLPLMFLRNYLGIIINMIFWGIPLGGFWVMVGPVSADVIDNSVVLTKKREEGVYTGFQMFFGRLGIVAQALTFAIVHSLTGFDTNPYSDLAIIGIHLHTSIIPAIFVFIGATIFWKYYDLKPKKVEENRSVLQSLKL